MKSKAAMRWSRPPWGLHQPKVASRRAAHTGARGFIWKPRIIDDLITEVRQAFQSDHTKDERSSSHQSTIQKST